MQKYNSFVTFLICSRKMGNPDSALMNCLNSITQNIDDKHKQAIEVLIKFDTDDKLSYEQILNINATGNNVAQPNLLRSFPFPLREFVYARGEGRRSLQNDYMFLFSQRNISSKYISFLTDDCIIMKKGLIEFLMNFKERKWCILGEKKPNAQCYPNYRNNQEWRNDVSMFPIISTHLLEILQNMGWQTNIDNWLTLLYVILYNTYALDLFYGIEKFIGRMGGQSREKQYPKMYNPFEINNLKLVENQYYFDLIEQQAKNVYLNWAKDSLYNIANTINKSLK